MSTPLNSERLLRILVGRHRRLSNIIYKQILIELNNNRTNPALIKTYRGITNDLVGMLKEMREQEKHNKNIQFYDIFEQIEAMEGQTQIEKIRNWLETQPKQDNQREDILIKVLGRPEEPHKARKKEAL